MVAVAPFKRTPSTGDLQAAPQPLMTPLAAMAPVAPRQQRRLTLRFRGCRLSLPVPSEMWGAAALAVRLSQPAVLQPQLQRASSAVLAQAFSAAAAPPPPAGPASADHAKELAEALEWRPQLSAAEEAAALLSAVVACIGVYIATAPKTVQPLYAAGMALLCAAGLLLARMLLLERRYKAIQRSEKELVAADSRFVEVGGIQLHYKRRTPLAPAPAAAALAKSTPPTSDVSQQQREQEQGELQAAVHCLHGFGASLYSWSFVQQQLADALHAVVTAHDMPGFGLSQRPRSPSYYTLHFNGDAARHIVDMEAEQAHHAQRAASRRSAAGLAGTPTLQQQQRDATLRSHPLPHSASCSSLASGAGEADSEAGEDCGPAPLQPPPAPKRVLIGHSMGAAAAAEGVIANPQDVAALVLVAPAIVALWLGPPEEAAADPVASAMAVVEEMVEAEDAPGEVKSSTSASSAVGRSSSSSSTGSGGGDGGGSRRRSLSARRVLRAGAVLAKACLLLLVRLALLAATPLLVLLLRRLVRSRRFWERGLVSAWSNPGGVTRQYVDAYRSGQLVRGWEGGILRFLAARFNEKAGFWGSVRDALKGEGHVTQAERLAAVVRRHGIRVLIVHGSADVLVPPHNSRRLASLLPNAQLAIYERCGHMPHEECPEKFVETVRAFVQAAQ